MRSLVQGLHLIRLTFPNLGLHRENLFISKQLDKLRELFTKIRDSLKNSNDLQIKLTFSLHYLDAFCISMMYIRVVDCGGPPKSTKEQTCKDDCNL